MDSSVQDIRNTVGCKVVIILDQEKGQGGMKKGQGGRNALSLY